MKRHFLYSSGVFAVFLSVVFLLPHIAGAATTNLINNPGFEVGTSTPQGWFRGKWGNNTAVFRYPVSGPDASKAVEVELSSRVTGDAKWYSSEVPLTPGKEYYFEDAYRSTKSTYITMQYRLQDGSFIYKDLIQPSATGNVWKTASTTFVVPAGVVAGTVFHLINSDGVLATDNVILRTTDAPVPTGIVSLTFDDGHREVYENALPILTKYGLKSTQYIISGYFGFPDYMTSAQVLDMERLGHEIGAHTQTHRDLTTLSTTTAQAEIAGSKKDLLAIGVKSITTFSYPFGAYNDALKQIVMQEGFKGARSSDGGFNPKGNLNLYALARKNMGPETSIAQAEQWIDEAMRDHKWLIFVFHHINNSGEAYSVSPAFLDTIAAYLSSHGVPVVTLTQGIDVMK